MDSESRAPLQAMVPGGESGESLPAFPTRHLYNPLPQFITKVKKHRC